MHWQQELEAAIAAARTAGAALQRLQRDGFETARKANQDPVTTADLEADTILREALLGRFPQDGWLSEETVDDARRLACPRVWVVDPLDGTKEYVQAIDEYCVSVALVKDELPVVGVIFNPSRDLLYSAVRHAGAWCNGEAIHVRSQEERLMIAASRSEVAKGKWKPFEDAADVLAAGSAAHKLALVAGGDVDATFTMAPRNEWDIAAGVLLVDEAGGVCRDRSERELRFNQADPLKDGIFAASRASEQQALGLLRKTRAAGR